MKAEAALLICGILLAAAPAGALTLAKDGRLAATIVVANDATPEEQTAASELAGYVEKISGARLPVFRESAAPRAGACVFVGPTRFAAARGLGKLAAEEWAIRTAGGHLVLAGGRPRGTLYAVSRFLEDVAGVHWWNPFEESVPRQRTFAVGRLERRGRPAFRYRDIYMLYGADDGRFAARNRLNRQGDTPIAAGWGGSMNYGPPYHVHTFYSYVPPATYFAQHPEWYSLVNGKRTADDAQLCLTNPELRRLFVEKLRAYIESTRKGPGPAPVVFDISQNDWGGMCQCDRCQAVARAEGSEAGPLIEFVNAVADAIKPDYPDVFIDTLAYQMTQDPPRTVRPRDNVIVRLCNTTGTLTRPITDPANAAFRQQLLGWARIARNLRVWDYAVTYADPYGLPLPSVHNYPANYRFYAAHNVEGVFTEHEYPILADLRDLKVWMMIKLLEDPSRDYAALLRQFTDGFYGPAGALIREYLARLQAAEAARPVRASLASPSTRYSYLTLAFLRDASALFDRAEAKATGSPVLLRRVRHARLPLDRAILRLYPRLVREWVAAGRAPDSMPLDRDAVARRCRDTWYAQADLRLPGKERPAERARADAELAPLLARRAYVPLPEKFRGQPAGTLLDYTADTARNWQGIARVVPDPEAESGITNRLELKEDEVEKYRLPMPWGLYDTIGKAGVGAGSIKPEDVPGPGYHWYRMGAFAVRPATYLYFLWSWIIQVDLDDAVDAKRPDRKWEVWARIKFEGPAFPHGRPEQKNAICVERVVLSSA